MQRARKSLALLRNDDIAPERRKVATEMLIVTLELVIILLPSISLGITAAASVGRWKRNVAAAARRAVRSLRSAHLYYHRANALPLV